MRLLYVTSSFPFGPGEAFLLPEITELGRQGHAVTVVPMYPRGKVLHAGCARVLSVTVREPLLSRNVLVGASRMISQSRGRAQRTLRLVLAGKPRHLMKNMIVFPKGLWLGALARDLRVQHIHVHWAATTASMGMVASAASGIPWSFTAHRWDIVDDNNLVLKARCSAFTRFISMSGLELARSRGLVGGPHTFVLGMGVRIPTTTAPRGPSRDPERPFRLLCPASLQQVKGHVYLLRALQQIDRRVELWLAGEGRLRKLLETLVAELALENRVRFLGQLPNEELIKFYQDRIVDAVVLPSVDLGDGVHEGVPVALLEAMAHEVPVISTQTGGIPELLEGGAGLLVPPGEPRSLALAIQELADDEDLAQKVAKAGRGRVAERHAVKGIVAKLVGRFEASGG